MITELCAVCKNYFIKSEYFGKFEITNGNIALSDYLQEGQYFRVVGSVFNDGVYQYPTATLTDEIFEGSVWAMSLPPAFIALADKIKEWCETNKNATDSPFASESYPNGYSYSMATGADGMPIKWQSVFAKQIAQWRKI